MSNDFGRPELPENKKQINLNLRLSVLENIKGPGYSHDLA